MSEHFFALVKFAAPEWFLLLPAFAGAAWFWPRLGLARPLRALCLFLLTAALAQPMLRLRGDGLDLWVLVDRSLSDAARVAKGFPEWESILRRSMGSSDRLHIIDFAGAPALRGEGELNPNDLNETRTALALQFALPKLERDRLSRILLLSDGYSTEPLSPVIEPLLQSGVPLDRRLLAGFGGSDFRVASIEAPQRVQFGESFLVEARIAGTADGTFDCEILRDGVKIGSAPAKVEKGEARIRFAERLRSPGAHRYSVRILSGDDAHPENNENSVWVEAIGGARILVISAFAQDPVADALRGSGFDVQLATDPSKLNAGSLSGIGLVVINNVPAFKIADEFLRAADFFVTSQGGGLLMTGGRFSFGSGGYFASPIDPLLPVSMELKKDHRKLRVAVAIVMDRSGSMAMGVSDGLKTVTKMELADEGAARSAELLGDSDLLSVIAVDTDPHIIIPLTALGPSRENVTSKVRRIRSEGGGIFVYEGLEAAWKQLQKADAGQKYVILFADASDSKEPKEYKKLLEEMTAAGAIVSVIGMGTDKDPDAALLTDIALRGKGRIMFSEKVSDLPALFAQETVAIARSAFITEPVAVKSTPGWREIASAGFAWLPETDAYNLSYAKPGATIAALSGDEYAAPLVAFWQRGLGRTATISFPMAGEYSEKTRAWPAYNDFVATLARWLSAQQPPEGLGIKTKVEGTELGVDLYYDGREWNQRVTETEPKLMVAQSGETESRVVEWDKLSPGRFHARISLRPGVQLRGVAQVGKYAIPFGPISIGSNAEWQFPREAVAELKSLSSLSGGKERIDLATSWEATQQRQFRELGAWLIALLLLAVVADALVSRLSRA